MGMFTYRAPLHVKDTAVAFDPAALSIDHCGLFRAPLHLAASLMPNMAELIETAPIDGAECDQWELDIKVHMLMKDQYPCIPNWHCDNVPRADNRTRYDLIDTHSGPHDFTQLNAPRMFLWVSDEPTTEFLNSDVCYPKVPESHLDVAQVLGMLEGKDSFQRIRANAWYSMDQQTPHRGRKAERSSWRVFARLTHRSIAPARPVVSVIRRHAQVYLDADTFAW